MNTLQLIADITSRDTHKVWSSSCEIISLGQDERSIQPLIEYLPLIKKKAKNLAMGGTFAPNQRFVDFAIRTIEFHRDSIECSCTLYAKGSGGSYFLIKPNNGKSFEVMKSKCYFFNALREKIAQMTNKSVEMEPEYQDR